MSSLYEAAQAAEQAYKATLGPRDYSPGVLARLAAATYRDRIGSEPPAWMTSAVPDLIFADLLAECKHRDCDALVWIHAVIDDHQRIGRPKGWRLEPGILLSEHGERAHVEFLRAFGPERVLAPEMPILRSAEFACAALAFDNDDSIRRVEEEIHSRYPCWSLARTMNLPHLRLPALRSAVEEAGAVGISKRHPAPVGRWLWVSERDRWLSIIAGEAARVPRLHQRPSIDPDLGELL